MTYALFAQCGSLEGQQRGLVPFLRAARGLKRILQPFHSLVQLPVANGQPAGELVDDLIFAAVVVERPPAAAKLDAQLAPLPAGADDLDQANFAAGGNVGAAAGCQVKVGDLYEPELVVVNRRNLAQIEGCRFLMGDQSGGHRPVFPHDPVGQRFRRRYRFRRQGVLVQIDGYAIRPKVEAHRLRCRDAQKRLGENVLPRVMLHMVKAARPIDHPMDCACRQGRAEDMDDGAVFGLDIDIDHRRLVEHPAVVGLSAGAGIEVGLLQNDGGATLVDQRPGNLRRKAGRVAVVVIFLLAHNVGCRQAGAAAAVGSGETGRLIDSAVRGQGEAEAGAALRIVFDPNAPAVRLHRQPAEGKTQAQTSGGVLTLQPAKLVEDHRAVGFGNAGPLIADGDRHEPLFVRRGRAGSDDAAHRRIFQARYPAG